MRNNVFLGCLAALILVSNMILLGMYAGPILALFPQNIVLINILNEVIAFVPPVLIYFLITQNSGIKETFYISYISPSNIILITLISIIIQPALMAVSAVSSLFFPNAASDFLYSMSNMPALSTLIITSLMPAFFEEMYFRGLVLSNFKNTSPLKACILGGIIFGMAHLNFQQFTYAAIMGIIFCYFVYKTGSVFSSMLSHFVINGIQTILSALMLKTVSVQAANEQAKNVVFSDLVPFLNFALISIIPLIFLFIIFAQHNPKENRNHVTQSDKIFNLPLFILVVIFIFYSSF